MEREAVAVRAVMDRAGALAEEAAWGMEAEDSEGGPAQAVESCTRRWSNRNNELAG
jgi:hypothetical protein